MRKFGLSEPYRPHTQDRATRIRPYAEARRNPAVSTSGVCLLLATAVVALCCASAAVGLGPAQIARSERLAINARLKYVTTKGAYLLEQGLASGPLAGIVKARVRVTADISGSFTFYPRGGSITGRGAATLHESGTYASFGGVVKITGGTGRYAHARGEGGLYGVYNRKSLEIKIQTTGRLSY